MGSFAIIAIIGGALILIGLYLWARQRQQLGQVVDVSQVINQVPLANSNAALLVATEHGQLIHTTRKAREWMGIEGGSVDLEFIAGLAEPAESFLDLFAGEGQASFQLMGRWIEASSHTIPSETGQRVVVVLRELSSGATNPDALDLSEAIAIVNQIGELVNASMSIEQVLQVLLEIITKAVPASVGEIALWDKEDHLLRQRGWTGDTRYLLLMAETGGTYRIGEGIAGWMAQYHQPILISDRSDPTRVYSLTDQNPYQSVVAIPLLLGERLIGTLSLFGTQAQQFVQAHLALLQAVSKPIAIAIYNAELYGQQVQRITDIASLQQITDHAEAAQNTRLVYEMLNRRIAELMSADMCGVFLYDEDRHGLVAQLPFHGLPDHVSQTIFINLIRNSPQREIWENQPYWVSNDLVDEPLAKAIGMGPLIDVAGIRNTALIPMQIGGERIGMIAISNKHTEGGFTPRDIQNLRVLTTQAAIVVENIRLYEREQRISAELKGLQEMTEAIGALSHEGEFYLDINERIARLMNCAMCGVLLYDEADQALIAQPPFYGVDTSVIQYYRIPLTRGTILEELWTEENFWYSNRVASEALVFEADLDLLAEAAGVNQTMMAVMSAGGRRVGVVQVSNRLDESSFTDNDARLLLIFATQAASIIENARLYQQVQRSATEAQSLRRVAELAGTILTPEQPVQPVLEEIARATNSPMVFVNLFDHLGGRLVTYPRWNYGLDARESVWMETSTAGFEKSVSMSGRPYMSNDVPNDETVLPAYRSAAQRYQIQRMVMVPLNVGDRSLGEMGIANRQMKPYTEEDIRLLQVVAAQISSVLDRLQLFEAAGENLRRRVEELDSISRISNELTLTTDLSKMLDIIRHEAAQATRADGSTIALLLPSNDWVHADEPEMRQRIGDAEVLYDLADVERAAILRGVEPVLVTDYANQELSAAPHYAKSALATAFLYLDQIVGVIHVHHSEANHFDSRAATFLTALATKASLAYQNELHYREQLERNERLGRRVDQLRRIFELGQMLQTQADAAAVLEAIAYSIQQSVGYDTVVMLMADEKSGVLRRVAQAGMPLPYFEKSKSQGMAVSRLAELLREEYRIGDSYFFPIEKIGEWHVEGIEALSTTYEGNRTLAAGGGKRWVDGDMLLIRIHGAGGNLLGIISVDRPHNNIRPDRSIIEILETFAHQASSMLENIRLFNESRSAADQEAQLNRVMETISSTLDINRIVEAVAEGIQQLLPIDRMTVVVADAQRDGYDLIRVLSQADQSLVIEEDHRYSLERTALGRVVESQSDSLYRIGDHEINDYEDLHSWYTAGEQTSLIVPLIAGGECLGAVHLGSKNQDSSGFQSLRPLLRRIVQLVASAVQNARLFNEAVTLQILNRSVVESIQQGIVVLDSSARVLSINDFMRQRYDWTDEVIHKDLFAYQPQLAEYLTEDVRTVLESGVPKERIGLTLTGSDQKQRVSNYYLYPLLPNQASRGAVLLVEDVTERAELEKAIENRANQLAALTEVSTRISSSLDRGEVISLALEEMGFIIPFDVMTIWGRSGPFISLEDIAVRDLRNGSHNDLPQEELRLRYKEYERVRQVIDGQRVIAMSEEAGLDSEGLPGEEGIKSWIGVPLVSQGHVVGLIVLTKAEAGYYQTREEQHVALAFGGQVAIALANADLFEQTFDRTNELGILLEAAQATSAKDNVTDLFRTIVELMFNALDMDKCRIMIWDEVDNELEVQVDMNRQGNIHAVELLRGTRLNLGSAPAKLEVLRTREAAVIVDKPGAEDHFVEELNELREWGFGARMLVPLVTSDQSLGLIQLEQVSNDEQTLTQQKVRLAKALSSQVAVAIEKARLSVESQARFEEMMTINTLSRAISSTLKLSELVDILRKQIPSVANAEEVYLALYNAETDEITFPMAIRGGVDFHIPPRPLGSDEVSYIINKRRSLNLGADYFSVDELRRSLGIVNGEGDAKSYMGVPLKAGDEVVGVLAIRDRQRTRAFTVNNENILSTVGAQIGVAIQNARLYERVTGLARDLNKRVQEKTQELEAEKDRLDTLYQITSELGRTLDMDLLLGRALGMVSKAVGAEDGVILLSDPVTDNLYSRAVLNEAPSQENQGEERHTHPAQELATWLIQSDTGDRVIVVDDLHDTRYWNLNVPGAEYWRSALAVLLEMNEDPVGVMVLLSSRKDTFNEDHLKLLVPAANQVAAAINSADLYQLIRDQAERLGTLLRTEQEASEQSSAILESIADGVLLADSNGNIKLFNSASERILQLPRDQVLGQPLSKLTGIYGASATRWEQVIGEWSTNPADHPGSEYIDERLQLGDRIVSVHHSPVYTGTQFLGTVSVFRDITSDVEADRMKSQFITNVSHEFRTPLTPIKGFTDLLLMGAAGMLNDKQSGILQTIKDNVDRLSILVNDVLSIANLDIQEQFTMQQLLLSEIVPAIVERIASRASNEAKDIRTSVTIERGVPPIRADRDKLIQMITNIVDNAFKYTRPGGRVDVRVSAQPNNKTILISVADTGVGIPDEFKDAVWRRFERYEPHALELDVAGTGLGLSIVKELVNRHSGKVWFESELGEGTTFYIELPIEQPNYSTATSELAQVKTETIRNN